MADLQAIAPKPTIPLSQEPRADHSREQAEWLVLIRSGGHALRRPSQSSQEIPERCTGCTDIRELLLSQLAVWENSSLMDYRLRQSIPRRTISRLGKSSRHDSKGLLTRQAWNLALISTQERTREGGFSSLAVTFIELMAADSRGLPFLSTRCLRILR